MPAQQRRPLFGPTRPLLLHVEFKIIGTVIASLFFDNIRINTSHLKKVVVGMMASFQRSDNQQRRIAREYRRGVDYIVSQMTSSLDLIRRVKRNLLNLTGFGARFGCVFRPNVRNMSANLKNPTANKAHLGP